ncbi:MAG TPA: hypothetical protein VFI09_05015 [Solirubrobacterales bacterium]|nr:hypothetical protein [Solirubrobacterales bacterium]
MALSEDQRALLRLLAQREQGYDDIAALKGMSVEDVRAEVREALAAMDAPPPEPPPPPAPTPAPESKPEPPPAPAVEPQTPPSAAKPKATARPRRQRPAVPAERRRIVLIAGGALALVAIVLGAVAIFGSGSDSSSSSGSASGEAGGSLAEVAEEEGKVTQAVLEAADGSEASGRAIFGRVGKKEVVLQVTAENLEPTEKGQSYTVWLYRTPKLSLRIGSVPVGETGKLGARFSIPAELLAYVASGAFDQIYVSRTSNAAYQQEVAKAKREKSLPLYTGDTVLIGEITGPVAKAGQKEGS